MRNKSDKPVTDPAPSASTTRCCLSDHIGHELAEHLRKKWINNSEDKQTDIDQHHKGGDDEQTSNKKPKLEHNKARIYTNPFRCVVLDNVLDDVHDTKLIKDLEIAADQIKLNEKNNDLYRFRQSDDLNKCSPKQGKTRILKQFIHLFSTKIMDFVEQVTGFELDREHIDLTVSKYDCKEYLLCHDDDIRGKRHARKVAFVYYLVDETWSRSDGGSLILYDTAPESNEPVSIAEHLTPKRNSLVFFETNTRSWHSVEEVRRPRGGRLSINGWFHAPIEQNTPSSCSIDKSSDRSASIDLCPRIVPLQTDDDPDLEQLFLTWVNHEYMMEKTWKRIRRQFSQSSEINLTDFLAHDKYNELCDALTQCKSWNSTGPYSHNKYKRLDEKSDLPGVCKDLLRLFRNGMFFMLLAKLTGLKLHPDVEADSSSSSSDTSSSEDDDDEAPPENEAKESKVHKLSSRMEFRLWEAGSYTLVHDHGYELKEKDVLDCILHFNHESSVDFQDGGYISYIAKNEDEELLTVEPKSNFLSLVYRDRETARFVKYLSNDHEPYYDLSCVYYPK